MRRLVGFKRRIAVRMTAPSPLMEEGITAGQSELGRVRGLRPDITMRRQPLTHLHFAQPPSPTRGEGGNCPPHHRLPT